MIVDPRRYFSEELLRDGGSIHIRALRPDDKRRRYAHFQQLSARSIHFRSLGAKKLLTDDELARFTELDFESRVALVATLGRGEEEKSIGVGRYDVLATEPGARRSAEVAFAVLDEHQGRGIGTLLLEHLLGIARQQGIREFEADVMGENQAMLGAFRSSGLLVRKTLDSGVALVGASRRPDTIGGTLLANLKRAGFPGAIYPVNPKAKEIGGLPSYPSVSAIGAAVDLALVAVPARLGARRGRAGDLGARLESGEGAGTREGSRRPRCSNADRVASADRSLKGEGDAVEIEFQTSLKPGGPTG